MTILGFNFKDIKVNRKDGVKGKVNIKNNVVITDIKEKDLNLGDKKQSALSFIFEFSSKYEPDLGEIVLGGDLLLMESTTKTKEVLDEWKKAKRVPKDVMTGILNTVLTKCNIEALILSQAVNLPPPIPLPSVQAQPAEEVKKAK
ncbi:MAG: hypothetical protein KKC75_08690 [Nanoarchaeota archaeon]|nr:hypothetical protein [Nanoarchaeota archaeon]MBU1005295.1 hypothetical protein [Nanoarchaeota archaeon]MBU1946226.1 hypothetical protein [Nanoarchaeota archaeon]